MKWQSIAVEPKEGAEGNETKVAQEAGVALQLTSSNCTQIYCTYMQLHKCVVKSPLSPCFHVNSRQVSATQGHCQVYMTIFVNCYTVPQYYTECLRSSGKKFKDENYTLV
jgi:hypothetical protein